MALWDRMEGETGPAWVAFLAYKEAGVKRQKSETYRRVYCKPEAEQPAGFFSVWAKKYEWDKRAVAWDNEMAQVFQRKVVKNTEGRAALFVKQSRALQAFAIKGLAYKDPREITMRDIMDLLERGQVAELRAVGESLGKLDVNSNGTQTFNQLVVYLQENPEIAKRISDAPDMDVSQFVKGFLGTGDIEVMPVEELDDFENA